MQVFNKLIKPVFASLHELGYPSFVNLDDSLLLAQIFDNLLFAILLFQEFGFVIHPQMSIFVPTQKITIVGVETDALNMTLVLTSKKNEKITHIAVSLLLKQSCSISLLASFLGNIISSFEALESYVKGSLKNKNEALRTSMGNFDIKIKQLSSASLSELKWRQSHIIPANLSTKPTRNIYCIINTDASESG